MLRELYRYTDIPDMDFLDTNHWVPIHTLSGFESCIEYYVSRDGEVLSTKGGKEKILKQSLTSSGYMIVHLRKRLGERGEICTNVHKLVAYAFLPPPPTPHGRGRGQSVIDHIDHNRINNAANNLRWATAKDNCKDKRNFLLTEPGQTPEHQRKREYNKRYMQEKRLDPEFRKKEAENAMEYYYEQKNNPELWGKFMEKKKAWKEANPEKHQEHMRKCYEKRAKDPERMAKLKEYKKNYRENVKKDPEKLEAQREYQREYMRKRRAEQKAKSKSPKIEESDN